MRQVSIINVTNNKNSNANSVFVVNITVLV